MNTSIKKIMIVGGGTAGWLVACVLASKFMDGQDGIEITLIESDVIPTLGVGEGTWPSMRNTLKKIGLSEKEFIVKCSASFKQGSKFVNWQQGDDVYYHPFQLPLVRNVDEIKDYLGGAKSFAQLVSPQIALDTKSQAPKLITTDDYAAIVNYGYHLDAGKFGELLRDHAMQKYGVKRVVDTIVKINAGTDDYIESVITDSHGQIAADFFIDCSGFASILMKQHYKIPFVDCKDVLFNDRAIAVQIPYANEDTPINSYTISTAQKAGWIWDIGLSSRRGVGYTYSSVYATEESATEEIKRYINKAAGLSSNVEALKFKKIQFQPGYLKKFWHKNCVAIGVSSGFIEPLEASALAMVELSASMLADNFPYSGNQLALVEKKYNERFGLHWQQIIEFLKLHYVLSQRNDSEYWMENKKNSSIPNGLQEKLEYWKYYPPSRYDEVHIQELFPVASYQYVLYGMGCMPYSRPLKLRAKSTKEINSLEEVLRISQQLERNMPTNRSLLDALKTYHND